MSDYADRRRERAERYRRYAEDAERRSRAAFDAAHSLADSIPLGQPILVSHHSERRARRDASRIQSGVERGIAEQRKAEYWRSRALSATTDTGIRSDDPDAPELLREKIAGLEAKQAQMKAINAAVRKAMRGKVEPTAGLSVEYLRELAERCRKEGELPFAPFELANLSANIRRYRQRLAAIKAATPPEGGTEW